MDNPIEVVVPTQNEPVVPVADNNAEMVPKAQLDAVVNELKDLRSRRVEVAPVVDVDKKIMEAFKLRQQEEASKNWQKAQDLFIAKNKEFHPENDPGGLKKAALDKELSFLNRDGLSSIEDLTVVLERAKVLATSIHAPTIIPVRIDPSTPRSNPEPRSSDGSDLSPKELRMIDQLGWTPERFLKLKLKDPAFVENALRQAS